MIPRSVATPYRLTSHLPNSVAPPPTSGLSKSTIAQLIETGPQRAFELLVEQQSVNVAGIGFENGQNCLHLAIAAGHTGVAYYLLKQAPDCTEKLVNGTDFNGNTPLIFDYAIERDLWRAILELTLLGYSASDQLIKAAQRSDRVTSTYLVGCGVDTVPVLMHFATLPEPQPSGTSVTSFAPSNPLSMINLIIQELKMPPIGPKLALFRLARHEDLTPLRRLAETVVCGPLTLCELSKYRAEALKILNDVGLVPPMHWNGWSGMATWRKRRSS